MAKDKRSISREGEEEVIDPNPTPNPDPGPINPPVEPQPVEVLDIAPNEPYPTGSPPEPPVLIP
jgi:hypothetical protein